MRTHRFLPVLALLAVAPHAALAQDTPTPLPKDALPAKGLCLVCSQSGEGEEKLAAGAQYKGKRYFFCNAGELKRFLKDPEALIPAPTPRPAPAFSLPAAQGGAMVSLGDFAGKLVLVDFWATWCKPCVAGMPALQKLQERYGADGAFTVVGISIDEEGGAKVGPFLAKSKTRYTYPMALDMKGTVWQAWGVRSIPFLALVRDGQIVRQWSGAPDLSSVEQAVREELRRPTPN